MKNVKILDVTLRDGGYINDWQFGFDEAKQIAEATYSSGIDYVELGFIGNHENVNGRLCFDSMQELSKVFVPSKAKMAAMVYAEGYPVTKFPDRSEKTIDMVRVIFWKRNFAEGVDYVKALVDKGYEVGVQLARTDQYDLSEIGEYVHRFSEAHPTAVYLVDSFGTFNTEKMLNYARIYDEALGDDILFGFHPHNCLSQAFSNAVTLCEQTWKHTLILDASVLGMGRGAGNLNLELILNYLNSKQDKKYDLLPVIQTAARFIDKYNTPCQWGYSLPYFLSGINGVNVRFVSYLQEKNVSLEIMEKIFRTMKEENSGIFYDTDVCDELINRFSN